jgi:hypothetical protein
MKIEMEERTFRRRVPVAFPELLRGELFQGVFLYGNAKALGHIVRLPTRFSHPPADVRIFVMEPIPHIVTADCVESFFTKQDSVPWSEFREARLFSELCFEKQHAPARKNSIRSGGNKAGVTGADARLAEQIFLASVEPIGVGKDFGVDAGDKRGVREGDGCIASGGDSLVLGKAKKRNPGRGLQPIGKRNWFGGAIVHDEDLANRI